MDAAVIATTFALIFVAELGDKSQLTAMTLAARHPWHRVLLGAGAAFAVLNLVAVGVGQFLFELVPTAWVQLFAGCLFLWFGVSSFRQTEEEEEPETGTGKSMWAGPATTAFVLILLSELGDKTQLVTAGLAARHAAPVSVFVGSTGALWLVSLLGVVAGGQIARVVPMRVVHRFGGVAFLLFGGFTLWEAVRELLSTG